MGTIWAPQYRMSRRNLTDRFCHTISVDAPEDFRYQTREGALATEQRHGRAQHGLGPTYPLRSELPPRPFTNHDERCPEVGRGTAGMAVIGRELELGMTKRFRASHGGVGFMVHGPRAVSSAPLTRWYRSSCQGFRKTRSKPALGSAPSNSSTAIRRQETLEAI